MLKKYVEGKQCFEINRARQMYSIMNVIAKKISDEHSQYLSEKAVNQESADDVVDLVLMVSVKELIRRGMLIGYK